MEEHIHQHAGINLLLLLPSSLISCQLPVVTLTGVISCASHNPKAYLGAQATWRVLPEQKTAVKYLTGHTQVVECLAASSHTIASGAADSVRICLALVIVHCPVHCMHTRATHPAHICVVDHRKGRCLCTTLLWLHCTPGAWAACTSRLPNQLIFCLVCTQSTSACVHR